MHCPPVYECGINATKRGSLRKEGKTKVHCYVSVGKSQFYFEITKNYSRYDILDMIYNHDTYHVSNNTKLL